MADQHPHHRPKFHISPPRGYLNDPNGPIQLGDELHLYYQSRSFPDLDVPVEWGHATTSDLVHWVLRRPAMSPVPGGLDSDGCWSGNTVVDGDRVRAFYSGHLRSRGLEHILTAVSDGVGASFGPATRVLQDPDEADGIRMLRDPFVWADADGWQMAIGSVADGGVAAIRHYRSDDGAEWSYVGHLAELARTVFDGVDTGEGWECPQIVRAGDREVAVVCSWSFKHGPGPVVAFPLDAPAQPRLLDDGHDFYAPSAVRQSDYGSLLFGWIREGRDPEWWQQEGWSGAISLPRRVWIGTNSAGDERLCSEPHPAIDGLRVGAPRPADGAELTPQSEIVVQAVAGRVRLRFGADEWVDIDLDPEAGTIAVDTDHASADARARGGRVVASDAFEQASARPDVRVFLDGSVIEVFTSGGRSVTTRAYPLNATGWTVEAPAGAVVWDLAATIQPEDAAEHPARA